MSGLILAAEGSESISLTGGNLTIVMVVALVSVMALAVAGYLVREVLSADAGTAKMQEIAGAVQEGASAYLRRQFKTLSVFAVITVFLLYLLPAESDKERLGRSIFFLVGAAFSAVTGYMGMWLAVRGNVRVAAAAREGQAGNLKATRIAFRTGGVAGMFTVGLGLLGASIVVLVYKEEAPKVLEGFGFGAALVAMFMRVGGGIFTKAADVGADLVGKVEQGIPEDDPRNAATIADNVGDNVGDCAGMAADLFESYAVTLVAALILGVAAFGNDGLVFPLIVPMIGVLTAIIGIFAVSPRKNDRSGMTAINRGFFISAVASAILCSVAAFVYLPDSYDGLSKASQLFDENGRSIVSGNPQTFAIVAVLIGIVLAAAIQQLTGYFTETNRRPVMDIGKTSLTGPATVILAGISVGLESAVYSAVLIALAVYSAYLLGTGVLILALFAVALAGTGLLTTVGVIVSMDTFGPVSDNAQGIAEMSGDVKGEGSVVLTQLDAVGNTTKAITKGIAIATAVLAATALFGSYQAAVNEAIQKLGDEIGDPSLLTQLALLGYDVINPNILVGMILGASVVFLFSGLAITAVTRAAGAIVYEVRRQFREIPGIMEGTGKPEYAKVVDICTKDSLRELTTPGLLAVLAPVAVGFGLGTAPLAGFLAGAIAAGVLMAVFLSNSGGAWDNAKKLVEDGHHGGKHSPAHEATIIGDTVGDPFKDTAGPAINPLIKVMNLVALLVAPAVVKLSVGDDQNDGARAAIAIVAVLIIVSSVLISKRRSISVGVEPPAAGTPAAAHSGVGGGPGDGYAGDVMGDPLSKGH